MDERLGVQLRERSRPLPVASDVDVRTSLELLGGFELRLEDRVAVLPMTARRLLVFLAFQRRPLARAHIAQSLWLEASEQHADGNLRSALWKIKCLTGSLVDATAGRLAIGPRVHVDLRCSTVLAEKLTRDPCSVPQSELDHRLLSEELLPDWYDNWVLAERERYRQLRLHGLECLCQRLTALGSFGPAVQAGLTAVAGEPLRESANLVLIRAYLAEGNRVEAIRHYRLFRALLYAEIGARPSDIMTRLVTAGTVRNSPLTPRGRDAVGSGTPLEGRPHHPGVVRQ
jgi:DNA-binding SARP family transcriptional activator